MEFLKKLLQVLKKILGVPDIHDEPGVRDFVEKYLAFAEKLVEWTPDEWDDETVELAQKLVANDQAWADIYGWILATCVPQPQGTALQHADLRATASRAGIDWERFMKIVELIIEILRKASFLPK